MKRKQGTVMITALILLAALLAGCAFQPTGGGAADPAAIGHKAHAKLFQDVLDAIEEGRKPLVDGYEGRRSVEVIRAVYESAKTGKTVKLG